MEERLENSKQLEALTMTIGKSTKHGSRCEGKISITAIVA